MNTMQRIAELVPEMKGEMRVPLTREVYEWVTSIAHDEKISQLLQSIPEGNDSPEAEEEIVKAIGRVCERVEKIVPDAGERPTAEIIAMFTAWFPAYRCLSETVPHHEEPPPESPVHEKN
jgi:hypothetical protein